MRCPLCSSMDELACNPHVYYRAECLAEDCAWWDKLATRCSMLSLAKELRIVTSEVHKLAEVVHCDVQERR